PRRAAIARDEQRPSARVDRAWIVRRNQDRRIPVELDDRAAHGVDDVCPAAATAARRSLSSGIPAPASTAAATTTTQRGFHAARLADGVVVPLHAQILRRGIENVDVRRIHGVLESVAAARAIPHPLAEPAFANVARA